MARTSDFVSDVRTEATAILDAIDHLGALATEWAELDYGSTLTSGDFAGENADTNVGEIAAVIGTTLSALQALRSAGHGTNLSKLRL